MKTPKGIIFFVGAGPGDPKLLTLRGKEVLEGCDVVIYDHLVNAGLLNFAPQARKIYGGKKGGGESVSQKTIETLLVRFAKKGQKVVRLKGGDPLIFGRWGEEALAVAKKKIPFEVIPGISAGFAAPAYAGIPLTHRQFASSVTFLTAHEDENKKGTLIDWKAVAQLKGTLVLFMGMKNLSKIAKLLIGKGKNSNTPVSVIEWGTTISQKTVSGNLKNIGEQVKRQKLSAPAVAVIGEVSTFGRKLGWFEKKPLFGKKILITRAQHQNSNLRNALEPLGASVTECPAIEITPVRDFSDVDEVIYDMNQFDWVVFTSENGVNVFLNRVKQLHEDARIFAQSKIAAVGTGTQAALASFGLEADLIPEDFSSEGLVNAFKKGGIHGQHVLLLRTNIAPRFLPDSFQKLGASVRDISVYETRVPKNLKQNLKSLAKQATPDFVVFTSSSTARNFFQAGGKALFQSSRFISVGPETSKTIRHFKQKVAKEARPHTIEGLVQAVLSLKSHPKV